MVAPTIIAPTTNSRTNMAMHSHRGTAPSINTLIALNTIDRWVEDGPKGRNLIELSRKPTIHPIGHPKHTKQQGCSGSFIFGEQQIQEQRKHAQPRKCDEVWNAEHSRPH
jgi:hypothetical protein